MKKILFLAFLCISASASAQSLHLNPYDQTLEKQVAPDAFIGFHGTRSEALAIEKANHQDIVPQPVKDSTIMILVESKTRTRSLFTKQDDNSWKLYGTYVPYEDENFGIKFLSNAIWNRGQLILIFNHEYSFDNIP